LGNVRFDHAATVHRSGEVSLVVWRDDRTKELSALPRQLCPATKCDCAHFHELTRYDGNRQQVVTKFQVIRIAIDNSDRYTADMATMHAHCHLNSGAPMGSPHSARLAYSFYYYYAYQAMLEGRSSGE